MGDDDESFTTFLAYTKSPKTTKRTSFQDELKKAINARVSRQEAIEKADNSDYSDEFESNDSLDGSFKKTTKSNSQKSIHDFGFSDDDDDDDDDDDEDDKEDSHKKLSFLKSRKLDKELDYSRTSDSTSKGEYERAQSKSPLSSDMKNGRLLAEDHKPTPKPREFRMKRSPSPPGSGISALFGDVKPTPQDRNRDGTEGKHTTNKPVSASSSLTRLNDKVSAAETQSFSERYSPEGLRQSDSPSPSARLKSLPLTAAQKDMMITKEETSGVLKALDIGEIDGHGNTESYITEGDPLSALEMMLTSVKEKSAQGENKDPRLSETHELYNSSKQNNMLDDKHAQNKSLG